MIEDNRTIGIVSLRLKDETLYFTGSEDLCDYMDFLPEAGKEDVVFEALLDYLEKFPSPRLELRSVKGGSPTLDGFLSLARRRDFRVTQTLEEVSPGIDLPSSWEEYLSTLSKKDRHELRRKMRRLTETGSAHFSSVTDTAHYEQDAADFFHLLRLNADKDEFMTVPRQRFFNLMMRRLLDLGWLKIHFLEVDNQRVSAVACFDYGGQVLLYNSGYDPAYSYLSVGLLLKASCLKEAIELGKTRFDFLRGQEPYKYDLGGKDVPVYHLTIAREGR
ncbi:MAG: GNAT family N-acetyltransferase [Dehalococcoidia bacterium]|nr:GNAT family N-acetyltransferase [Dehalococcoidia bacterium]